MVVLPIFTVLICITIGRYSLSVSDVITGLYSIIRDGRDSVDGQFYTVVVNIRLPRIILAIMCGAGLAVSGAAFQSLFSNALATPDTLGVAAGASFGAVLGLFFNLNLIAVQLLAITFGLAAVSLTFLISKKNGRISIIMLILSGMVVASMFNALISLVKFMADTEDQLPGITYWLMGSLANSNFKSLLICSPLIIIGTAVIFVLRWRLDILSLSEDEAISQGIDIKALRIVFSLAATAITASCVSMSGQVGWIGLLIPHICRMIFGSSARNVVPASISLGAVFMLVIDTVARSASSVEIPVSILTALIGAPIFIALLRRTGGGSL